MVTAAQLRAEPWYGREFTPPAIVTLGKAVREHFGLSTYDIGTKGDVNHLRGYHRSRAWVKNSAYCTNRSYSIKETPGNREGGNENWVCALDISAPPQVLLPMCQRLDRAVRSGRFEKVTEWYGNFDGDKRVDGYNNIADRVASSDSSHLTHCHISFDRGRAGEDHADLLAVLIGTEEDMTPDEHNRLVVTGERVRAGILDGEATYHDDGYGEDRPVWIVQAIQQLQADVAALKLGGVDVDALAAALLAAPGFKDALVQAAFEGAQRAEQE